MESPGYHSSYQGENRRIRPSSMTNKASSVLSLILVVLFMSLMFVGVAMRSIL